MCPGGAGTQLAPGPHESIRRARSADDRALIRQEKNMHRNPKRWRAVHDALAVTALAAVECALVMGLIAAIGFPHGGL
ncbi:hypothetical protein WL76_18460 [Burkholderia ubonensis]|uniref:Uncharacterized protein n=1 Tax=Burkholderia ubonensis TaxID=101571 RepID=A0A108CRH4_9BURK|nr:hypothetical protein WL76_18460 [Burkholderia ubonensis]KWE56908.1 hypothetical protein WL77_29285 [Burkholderia ubonensis]KWE69103.1 hypothetical protein WL79_23975 [Burkholderia ubonensis]KWK79596.1 hypothetical protein WM16_08670 [Burkholderia ubonensis]